MGPPFQALLDRFDALAEAVPDLREGVRKAVLVADVDPEMALTRARKVLEQVIRDVYARRCQEPPGTRPLENLQQRLVKDGHFPPVLDAYATTVRMLGNVGTHRFDQAITVAEVHQSLSDLLPILQWYVEVERPGAPGPAKDQARPPLPPPAARPQSKVAVVPKGLRSFDAQDADFFLDLLPGPRDKDGLPESIRFWKHRVEAGGEPTFTVGVLYGPSGCGKSSLVKAGLLPRLAGPVLSVYVEATADDTEARLLKGLRKRCPDLPADLDLTRTIVTLRQGTGLARGHKVLLVVDQFEQWLHANRDKESTELARALRQCDGAHVQCVVLVRDDFWMALTRFMQELQIDIVPGQNTTVVDLFDLLHARAVLSAFGRAFGRLPEDLTKEQEAFLDQAVHGLAQDGRVISVRLALFAEMVKGKVWTPATLKDVGGTAGVGGTFLEETFAAATAPPGHRLHQQAARAVLKALLPEQGSDIKGNMQSHDKLLQASGYARRPRDFEELLRMLDGEVRLITPTEPPATDAEGSAGQAPSAEKYYQLTHDYLVPSLRDWLTRKQKETRRGRAALRLAERAALWTARPENRHLPAWWEWLNIRLLTCKRDWTAPQRKMMRKATRYHALRGLTLAVLLILLAWGSWEGFGRLKAQALRDRLVNASTADVPLIVADMAPYRRWLDPLLQDAYTQAEADGDTRTQLHASLALLPVDPGQVDYLYGRLLKARPEEVAVLRDALLPYREQLIRQLWVIVEHPRKGHEGQRLRAACTLATYDPDNARWDQAAGSVVAQLVAVNPIVLGPWVEGFRGVKAKLVGPLATVSRDRKEHHSAERGLATNILADYAADQADLLADLVQDADEKQFAVLFPKLGANPERVVAVMGAAVATPLDAQQTEEEKEHLAHRQANAAVVLLRLGRGDKVWPLLKHPAHPQAQAYGFSDPRVRSYLIHCLGPLGADPGALVRRQLDEEKEVSIRRALLLCLGEFGLDQLAPADREPLIPKIVKLYREDPDAGLHGAAEWLLRRWGRQAKIEELEAAWVGDQNKASRAARQEQIKRELAGGKGRGEGYWYVNGQGQTMVVVPGPVEFLIGSPPTEAGRIGGPAGKDEQQQRKRIGRSFALAAREVTVRQFSVPAFQKFYREKFGEDFTYRKEYSPTAVCPVSAVSWYEAAAYCNWLSDQEGLPKDQWCYLPNAKGMYAEGMKPAPGYLDRIGYRLPSEAEWEYACRARALTSRSYGETEELLGKYAWYAKNSLARGMLPGPPGRFQVPGDSLKPNDFGLFDMLGNAMEWCQDPFVSYTAGEDREDKDNIKDRQSRVLRGGAFINLPWSLRCAVRYADPPTDRDIDVGFRPARTFR